MAEMARPHARSLVAKLYSGRQWGGGVLVAGGRIHIHGVCALSLAGHLLTLKLHLANKVRNIEVDIRRDPLDVDANTIMGFVADG